MLIDGKRALAYIVTIDSISSIEGADNIELAHVGGWNVIVHKQEYKPGDNAVFFEIDSLLPELEWSEFLRPKHFKVKTYKLGKFGVVSQGLLLPLSILPDNTSKELNTDVTDILGVKYAVPEDNKRKANKVNPEEKYKNMAARHKNLAKYKWFRYLMKRSWGRRFLFVFLGRSKDKPKQWPSWIKKTDEERCLIGDTKIATDQGVFRIADIVNKKMNVKVKSYNVDTGRIEYKPISSYQKYDNNEELIEIEYPYRGNSFRKNRVVCSKDHKFFVGNDYVRADNLHVNDKIYMPLTCYDDDSIPVIYGMLLGDSNIKSDKRCRSENVGIKLCQGEAQLDYLKTKLDMFGVTKIFEGKSGYCDNKVYSAAIDVDANISNNVLHDCYINGKKTITKDMTDKMNVISLAIWYLDDGSLKHRERTDGQSPSIILSTCAYTKEENELLIDMLINRFGVDCNLRTEKNKYWSIFISANGTRRFLNLIKDYIPESMKYKTLVEYENLPCLLNDIRFERKEMLIPINITNIKQYSGKKQNYIYDIEVADNHNFFANNVLTHNCENMTWVLKDKEPFVVTEKIDGTSTTFFLDCTKRKHEFGVCSRNVRQIDANQENFHTREDVGNVYWEMAFKYNIKDALEKIAAEHNAKQIVLQGETYGESVQSNPYKLKERRFAAFNLIFDGNRLGSIEAMKILCNYDVPFVPIIDEAYTMPDDFEEFKLSADGMSTINNKCRREGFVYRKPDGSLSFKNVSRVFLLKQKD